MSESPLRSADGASAPPASAPHVEGPDPRRADRARGSRLRSAAESGALALIACGAVCGVWIGTASAPATFAAAILAATGVGALRFLQTAEQERLFARVADLVAKVRGGDEVNAVQISDLSALRPLGELCNDLLGTIGAATTPALERLVRIELIPERAVVALANVAQSAEDQEAAVEEVASLMRNINASIQQLNDRMDVLSSSADESSASIVEMSSAVESVEQSASQLAERLETASGSVHEMGTSIRQVSTAAGEVQAMAEDTASAIIEIDRSINEVDGHVREAASLTEAVSGSAEDGSRAVAETIEDIHAIETRTRQAREVVESLARRIGEISNIVTVIDEISDETNLLSLNAAIIAAQAGEHGKAFLVVANHVKMLARRTTASTKDIDELIRSVQRESDNAVEAMGAGISAIEQGVTRSRGAGEALGEIRSAAASASERVAEIARASEEQARTSKGVANAAQHTSSQMQQISSAIREQLRASEQLLVSHEESRQLCDHVHHSTAEQRSTGRYIRESTEAILELIRGVMENTASHAEASQSVAASVTRLLENAQRSGEPLPELELLLEDLRTSAQDAVSELSRFQVSKRHP